MVEYSKDNSDVTMFLGERALAFRGSTQCVGDVHNGNFLGLLELISHYDPILLTFRYRKKRQTLTSTLFV